jgi:hypothetical protein
LEKLFHNQSKISSREGVKDRNDLMVGHFAQIRRPALGKERFRFGVGFRPFGSPRSNSGDVAFIVPSYEKKIVLLCYLTVNKKSNAHEMLLQSTDFDVSEKFDTKIRHFRIVIRRQIWEA